MVERDYLVQLTVVMESLLEPVVVAKVPASVFLRT